MALEIEIQNGCSCVARERRSERNCAGSGGPGCSANVRLANQDDTSKNESSGTPAGLIACAGALASVRERLAADGAADGCSMVQRAASLPHLTA